MPGTRPIAAKAEGNARAPAPTIVFVRLTTDEETVAMPVVGFGGAAARRLELPAGEAVGGTSCSMVPYVDDMSLAVLRRREDS